MLIWYLCKREETSLKIDFLKALLKLIGNFSRENIGTKRAHKNMNQKEEHSWTFNFQPFSSITRFPHLRAYMWILALTISVSKRVDKNVSKNYSSLYIYICKEQVFYC